MTTDSILYLQTVSFFSQFIFEDHGDHRLYFVSTNSFTFLCKQFHFSLNLFLVTKRTTDSILYLQTVSLFSQFIFDDHKDHRFYFVSANSFILFSIYFWGPQGPQIIFCIYKQFHFSLNLFLMTTRTTDSILYLQTVSFFSQFIFGDHKDHRLYFVSTNSFTFLSFIFGDHKDHGFYFVSTNTFIFLSIYFC